MPVIARPTRYLTNMLLFVAAVLILALFLRDPLGGAFRANLYLNGVILVVLVLGIAYALRLVMRLYPEVSWVRATARGEAAPEDSQPKLLAPVAALYADRRGSTLRMSAPSLRSLLDGVDTRLEESREISRYFTSLLVFLGLLGTFWGLLITIGEISGTIAGLQVDSSDVGMMFDALKGGLQGPLGGMATAFSSSLFGLAGSLVLGFLDLQAGQAQNRFYTDLEDWLTSVTKLTTGGEEAAAGESGAVSGGYVAALLEQTADEIADLNRLFKRADQERQETATALRGIAEGLAGLADQMGAQRAAADKAVEAQRDMRNALNRLIGLAEDAEAGLDEASRTHLRNIDVGLKTLIDAQTRSTEAMGETMRQEIKLLSRTIAKSREAETQPAHGTAQGGGAGS